MKVLGKVIDIRLKSPGWIKSLEEEMSVERICGSIPTSASSTLLAEDADMGDDDYDMEGKCDSNYLKKLGVGNVKLNLCSRFPRFCAR